MDPNNDGKTPEPNGPIQWEDSYDWVDHEGVHQNDQYPSDD